MPVIRAENAPHFNLPGLAVIGLAAPSRGAQETSVWRLRLEPSVPAVPHALDREEIFVGLAGRAHGKLGEQEIELGPGDTLIVPQGVCFSLAAAGAEAFEAVAVAPVGVHAIMAGREPFAPPWTE
jgi:mannose-6-phosphate isomerase-like protein (cupin superfamily)